ncbi:MAG TPA: hypothetical protein VE869_14665 [Gemmatimonas sp.]|nr:hypothetical protein [Gemmatimonas sp.]
MRSMRVLALVLSAVVCSAVPAAAQEALSVGVDSISPAIPRWRAGVAAELGRPTGDFHRNVGQAGGASAHLSVRLDQYGFFSLRLQGGYLNYGHESQRTCVAATPGCRVAATVSTVNGILSLGVGPEISLQRGRFRTYGHGLVSLSRFSTVSGLGGGLLPDFIAADENFGDGNFAWSTGAGVSMLVHSGVSVDLGVSYQGHGRRNYLIKGGVTDHDDGTLAFDVKRSRADLLAFQLGVSTPLVRKRKP